MKNIFSLPTDEPTRVYFHQNLDKLVVTNKTIERNADGISNRHIYIVCDKLPKHGDWVLNTKYNNVRKLFLSVNDVNSLQPEDKKIILTTDQELIKEGVQAIDDEFLEWFVNNSSCEFIEYDKNYNRGNGKYYYKIIIPKEEPYTEAQQKSLELNREFVENSNLEEVMSEFDEDELLKNISTKNLDSELSTNLHIGEVVDESYPREFKHEGRVLYKKEEDKPHVLSCCRSLEECYCDKKSKQATPEEVTLEKIKFLLLCNNNILAIRAIEEYGLYKQEKMYSEEDMREAFIAGGNSLIEEDDAYGSAYHKYMEEWFEQFKKK